METLLQILEQIDIMSYISVSYVIATPLIIYLYLSRIIIKPSRTHKNISPFFLGLLSAIVIYYFKNCTIEQLFISYLIIQVAYPLIINTILSKIGHSYDNKKGVM